MKNLIAIINHVKPPAMLVRSL